MIWLKALGNPVLYDEYGSPIGGSARHRRTIGLLSVLTVAGDAGLTRDKLTGLFWPDFDQKRARHSLTQAMYAARKAAGHDDLFDAGEDIRLNFERIGSDVREFEQHVAAGEDEAASDLYRGAFLDGFYLRSGEFDMWLTQERGRLENLAVSTLERALRNAELQGDLQKAVEYARSLNHIRPTDANAVINLMRLLVNAGDRPAALEQARRYTTLLREQYEMAPDTAVAEYAQEIHQEGQVPTPPLLAAADVRKPVPISALGEGVAETPRPTRRSRWIVPSVAVLALALLALLTAVLTRPRRPPPALQPLQQPMVIAPFRVNADPQLAYLGEGMIELLAARLADDSAARAMDAGAMIRAWRSADIRGSRQFGLDAILPVARQLGAERVVLGSVLGTPRQLIINASVVAVDEGTVTGRASVEGSADTLTALVDALARRLLLAQAEPDETFSDRMTGSLTALRSYVRGTGAYARGDYAQAERWYGSALGLDSTFALAALKLGMTAGRMADFELQRIAYDRAWQLQQNLSERERTFLQAQLGSRYPYPTPLRETIAGWNRAARLTPDRAETWVGLAAALFEFRVANGVAQFESVIAALQRALQLDPGFVHANVLLNRVRPADTAFASAGLSAVAAQSARPFLVWWRSATRDSSNVDFSDSLPNFGPANLRAIALASHYAGGHAAADGSRAIDVLLTKVGSADEAMSLLAASHSLALNRGRSAEAMEATRRMERLRPAGRAHLRLRILDAIYQSNDTALAVSAAAELETMTGVGLPAAAADYCVLAQWAIARGDMPRARRLAAQLKEQQAEIPILTGTQPGFCLSLLEAEIAVAERQSGAATRVAAFASFSFSSSGAGDMAAYANIATANLYRKLNQPADALAAIRRRPYGAYVWPRYLAVSRSAENALCALPALAAQCTR